MVNIKVLASEPREVIVSPTDYPRFVVNYDQLKLESQNQAKNIPMGLLSSPIKIFGKSVTGCLSYDRTKKNRKTNRDYNLIYIETVPYRKMYNKQILQCTLLINCTMYILLHIAVYYQIKGNTSVLLCTIQVLQNSVH